MTVQEMNRVLAAFPNFGFDGTIDKTLFGGFCGCDQYEYRKGRWVDLDDEDNNFKISKVTPIEFLNYLKREAAKYRQICIDNMPITEYVKKVNKYSLMYMYKLNKEYNGGYEFISIPGNEIEDWIIDHDDLFGIDPYTFLIYDQSLDYVVVLSHRFGEALEGIYPQKKIK